MAFMRPRVTLGTLLLYATSGLVAYMGIVDIAIREPPANYYEYMGRTARALDPRIGDVIYAFRAKIGVFARGTAGVIIILARQFSEGDKSARMALVSLVMLLAVGIPVLTYQMGAGPNLFVPPILGVLTGAAFLLTSKDSR